MWQTGNPWVVVGAGLLLAIAEPTAAQGIGGGERGYSGAAPNYDAPVRPRPPRSFAAREPDGTGRSWARADSYRLYEAGRTREGDRVYLLAPDRPEAPRAEPPAGPGRPRAYGEEQREARVGGTRSRTVGYRYDAASGWWVPQAARGQRVRLDWLRY